MISAHEQTFYVQPTNDEQPTVPFPSCSLTNYQTPTSVPTSQNLNSGSLSNSNYANCGVGVNGHKENYSNGSSKKTNMAKSNSLSDYNLYHNGKLLYNYNFFYVLNL